MSTVHFRPDYAKFLIDCPIDEWQGWYQELCTASHSLKFNGDFLKSHKVNRLWFNPHEAMETWSIDIWGEWAGIVTVLPFRWFKQLRRFDIRAIVWDCSEATITAIGKHLVDVVTSHNIHTYSSRIATKRMGRDRGGKGFAIGSHKSDLRITVYKRTGEATAQEFQMSGNYLRRLKKEVIDLYGTSNEVNCYWTALKDLVRRAGEQRFRRITNSAGLQEQWEVIGPDDIPELQSAQHAFIAQIADEEDYPDELEAWDRLQEQQRSPEPYID